MSISKDFSKGSVSKNILKLAVPMTLAQLINILYNIVDRMYIGRIPNASSLALTGVGITFPIITIIMAFANLYGMGGAPLCSIERGKGNNEKAEEIMGNSFTLLLITGLMLTIVILIFKKPLLYLLGASDNTFSYANDYITIYLLGSVFVMISLGMNSFINSQGFGRIGMMTILVGAITNIILDPIFIFLLHMGVIWVFRFLRSNDAILKLKKAYFKINIIHFKNIITLGLSGFIMSITNSIVQMVCNVTLQSYGGDLYVGVMTVLNSIREIVMMPVKGITSASQPVLGFNFGAKKYIRVKSAIKFSSIACIIYTTSIWFILMVFPQFFIKIFNNEANLVALATHCMNIYFFGFFMMSLQMSAQSTYVALGESKKAIFFSLLRKIIVVVPLTILLPRLFNLSTNGVFLAEPISNFIGGIAAYSTMILTVWKHLSIEIKKENEYIMP